MGGRITTAKIKGLAQKNASKLKAFNIRRRPGPNNNILFAEKAEHR